MAEAHLSLSLILSRMATSMQAPPALMLETHLKAQALAPHKVHCSTGASNRDGQRLASWRQHVLQLLEAAKE